MNIRMCARHNRILQKVLRWRAASVARMKGIVAVRLEVLFGQTFELAA